MRRCPCLSFRKGNDVLSDGMNPARRQARPRPYALALPSSLVIALACGDACMETRRSLGEDCLKNDDCLSGICSQLHCAASPPIIDARVTRSDGGDDAVGRSAEAATGIETGDALMDTATDASAESPPDAVADGNGTGD